MYRHMKGKHEPTHMFKLKNKINLLKKFLFCSFCIQLTFMYEVWLNESASADDPL